MELTGSALFTRSHTQTSLGLGSDNITFWGAPIPFSDNVYTGDALRGIPSSLNPDGSTNAAYRAGGRFGLNCPATGGCTDKQAWPVPPEVSQLFQTRAAAFRDSETARKRRSGSTRRPTGSDKRSARAAARS